MLAALRLVQLPAPTTSASAAQWAPARVSATPAQHRHRAGSANTGSYSNAGIVGTGVRQHEHRLVQLLSTSMPAWATGSQHRPVRALPTGGDIATRAFITDMGNGAAASDQQLFSAGYRSMMFPKYPHVAVKFPSTSPSPPASPNTVYSGWAKSAWFRRKESPCWPVQCRPFSRPSPGPVHDHGQHRRPWRFDRDQDPGRVGPFDVTFVNAYHGLNATTDPSRASPESGITFTSAPTFQLPERRELPRPRINLTTARCNQRTWAIPSECLPSRAPADQCSEASSISNLAGFFHDQALGMSMFPALNLETSVIQRRLLNGDNNATWRASAASSGGPALRQLQRLRPETRAHTTSDLGNLQHRPGQPGRLHNFRTGDQPGCMAPATTASGTPTPAATKHRYRPCPATTSGAGFCRWNSGSGNGGLFSSGTSNIGLQLGRRLGIGISSSGHRKLGHRGTHAGIFNTGDIKAPKLAQRRRRTGIFNTGHCCGKLQRRPTHVASAGSCAGFGSYNTRLSNTGVHHG